MTHPWVPAGDMFAPQPVAAISQGDLVLLPVAVGVPAGDLPTPYHARPPLGLGERVSVRIADQGGAGQPAVAVEVAVLPSLVVSHDCELDKELNLRINELVKGGMLEQEALAQAEADPSLDRWVVVSPLLPPTETAAARRPAIQAAQTIGYLPIPPHPNPTFGLTGFFVHLNRLMTVDRTLVQQAPKLASLSESGRSLLRFKLAETHASRQLGVLPALEGAIGQRLIRVEKVKAKKGIASANLVFEYANVAVSIAEAAGPASALQRTQ